MLLIVVIKAVEFQLLSLFLLARLVFSRALIVAGADLVYTKSISLMDALLGFKRKLTLLDGRRVSVVHKEVR